MIESQEDALYDFLENATKPFTLDELVSYIRMIEPKRVGRLGMEAEAFINARNIAFPIGPKRWISRRGCFEPASFVISPTRLELLNGILIPGHRCVPFANPILLPQEYEFRWQSFIIPFTTTEGPPEDFYPYYSIFGEEYAPQYVAQDNPDNESAFNSDPYEDPAEVSIRTLDMRNVYRETSFVPGDRFVVRTLDWRLAVFSLERVAKDKWSAGDLESWHRAAEEGFEDSFELLGPGSSTEEQIAYAYWCGGKRMREVPAYALEDFLYEKTDRVETTVYGIETRFWYTGREIPDRTDLDGNQTRPDRTAVEEVLYLLKVPISEYVVQSYVRDALYRGDIDLANLIERIVPPAIKVDNHAWRCLAEYITDVLEEFKNDYNPFGDKSMGPIRQRVGELHTAVIELTARLSKGEIDSSWLPKHTFIILSQIQSHAASLMEDLDVEEAPVDVELDTLDNSLDSMIETYEDIKELIDEALKSFRRNRLSVVRNRSGEPGRLIQLSVGGTEVWRRLMLPASSALEELHRIIQRVFGWQSSGTYRFTLGNSLKNYRVFQTEKSPEKDAFSRFGPPLDLNTRIRDLEDQGVMEFLYEYGSKWTVKIILLSRHEEAEEAQGARCVAGAGAAPPEDIGGPLRFRKFLSALNRGGEDEKKEALEKLGENFDPDAFDLEACNKSLNDPVPGKGPRVKR
jgi:hypothetical protein